jgi:hypothetical protein
MGSLVDEWVYENGKLDHTNIDTGEKGHEQFVIERICYDIGEDLRNDLEDVKNDYLDKENELLSHGYEIEDLDSAIESLSWVNGDDYPDLDSVLNGYEVLKNLDNSLSMKYADAISALKGDSRKYGTKKYGMILIRFNNFELWGWNRKRASEIEDAIGEIIQSDISPEMHSETINIHNYEDDKKYQMTIGDLISDPMSVRPVGFIDSKGFVPMLSAPGSRNWQQYRTSEVFKNWLMVRDGEMYLELYGQ